MVASDTSEKLFSENTNSIGNDAENRSELKESIENLENEMLIWKNRSLFRIKFDVKYKYILSNMDEERYYQLLMYFPYNEGFVVSNYILQKRKITNRKYFRLEKTIKANEYLSSKNMIEVLSKLNGYKIEGEMIFSKWENIRYGYSKNLDDGIIKLLLTDPDFDIKKNIEISYYLTKEISMFNAYITPLIVSYSRKNKDISRRVVVYSSQNVGEGFVKESTNNYVVFDQNILVFADEMVRRNKILTKQEFYANLEKDKKYYDLYVKHKRIISLNK